MKITWSRVQGVNLRKALVVRVETDKTLAELHYLRVLKRLGEHTRRKGAALEGGNEDNGAVSLPGLLEPGVPFAAPGGFRGKSGPSPQQGQQADTGRGRDIHRFPAQSHLFPQLIPVLLNQNAGVLAQVLAGLRVVGKLPELRYRQGGLARKVEVHQSL